MCRQRFRHSLGRELDRRRREACGLRISAVLRSWEARFGARLLGTGSDVALRVLIERPPATLEAATAVAAEHFAFAAECRVTGGWYPGDHGARSVGELAECLAGSPLWRFWWD
jgi:hypothetical protein